MFLYSPASRRVKDRINPICDVIDHTEEKVIVELLGQDNYETLFEDQINYADSPMWDENNSYATDATVLYEGVPYIALEDVSDQTPPDCSTKWTLADKFNTSCYNDMWTNEKCGLQKIVAWVVWATALPFYPDIIDSGGYADKGVKETPERINYTRSNLYSNINVMKTSFRKWNDKNGCLKYSDCLPNVTTTQDAHRKVGWSR